MKPLKGFRILIMRTSRLACSAPLRVAWCSHNINRAKPASVYCGKCGTFQRFHVLSLFCGSGAALKKGGVPFRVGNANPGGSRVEGDATDVEGSR